MHTVTIEILRTGESHNHGLSKKTKYIALCGSHPPVNFVINCDQDTFSKYKQMLRYGETDEKVRQGGIHFFEQLITKILDDIEPLSIEGQTEDWLHLRLVMTPKELSQLPFELALTPEGFQGRHSKPFLLNPQRLTTLTREVRQVGSARYLWPHKPRILFAWAEPDDTVPHEDHFSLLRDVVKHFARPIKDNAEPIPDIVPLITPLKEISLKSINDAVKSAINKGNPYTHIHILAHGIKQDIDGREDFRLVLHSNDDVNKAYYAGGIELANAILETDKNKTLIPAVVTLMACDSSNTGSISIPTGSLAHQLHESGIPCIFASQFPLSKNGSVKLVSTLYKKLLIEGEDPRKALYNTRKDLYDSHVHDWASLVAHIRFPEDIDEQLKDNRLKVLLESMKTSNAWAEHLLKHKNEIDPGKIAVVFEDINIRLDNSIKDLNDLFSIDKNTYKTSYAEHFGLLGSAFKRKAEHLFRMADLKKDLAESLYKESKEALKTSRKWYYKGYDEQKNHWTAIQYLSLTAITEGSLTRPAEKDIWTITRILAEDDAKKIREPMSMIWAWGTLAELYLLFPLSLPADKPGLDKEIVSAKEKAAQYIGKVANAGIDFAADPSIKQEDINFARESTSRQFERYISWWPAMMPTSSSGLLKELAMELLKGFS